MVKEYSSIDVRPYQLMCLVCRKGCEGCTGDYCHNSRLDEIEEALKVNPARPLTLRCNTDSVYKFQNPGLEYDTPEGQHYNELRDLTILCRMDLTPGATRPAIDIIELLYNTIPTCEGFCRFDAEGGGYGCRLSGSGNYERGHVLGAKELLEYRGEEEMAEVKSCSAESCYSTRPLQIRPHHLICMTCFLGGKEPGELEPIDEDNLYECIKVMRDDPEFPIEVVAGPCMICPPCPKYHAETNLCVGGRSMSLRDQKKDLDVMRLLDIEYGDIIPAGELMEKIFSKVSCTSDICGHGDGIKRSPIWWGCGAEGLPDYKKGKQLWFQ